MPVKPERLYKTLPAYAGQASARPASEHPVSSTGQAFEQPLNMVLFKNSMFGFDLEFELKISL